MSIRDPIPDPNPTTVESRGIIRSQVILSNTKRAADIMAVAASIRLATARSDIRFSFIGY